MIDPTEAQPSPELTELASDNLLTGSAFTPAAPEPKADAPAPSLDELLAEFESTATPKQQPEPQAQPQPQAPAADPLDGMMAELRELGLQHEIKNLTQEVSHARSFIDNLHFSEAVNTIEKRLADSELPVPAGYVKTALMAAAHDPAVASAFDNRGQSPANYNRVMRKLQDKIIADAKSMPDRDATETKMLVSNYMRGRSKMPAEPPPNFGAMNDAEFAKEKAKYGL